MNAYYRLEERRRTSLASQIVLLGQDALFSFISRILLMLVRWSSPVLKRCLFFPLWAFIEIGTGILRAFRMRRSISSDPTRYIDRKMMTNGSVTPGLNVFIPITSKITIPKRKNLTLGEVLRKVLSSSVEILFRLFDSASVSSKSSPGEYFKSKTSTKSENKIKRSNQAWSVFKHKEIREATINLMAKSTQLKFIRANLFNAAFMCMTPFLSGILSQNALKAFQFLTLNQSRRT